METMNRIEALLRDAEYLDYVKKNELAERERIYCHHDLDHFWSVARMAWILYLESPQHIPAFTKYDEAAAREILYAAAFLHDIGRFRQYEDTSLDHAAESALLAAPILERYNFSAEEAALVLEAIAYHRVGGEGIRGLLYTADKLSRPCFTCYVQDQCKRWQNTGPKIEK